MNWKLELIKIDAQLDTGKGLEWGTFADIIETLLSNMEKQSKSALGYLNKVRSDPMRYKPQLDNVRAVFNDMRGISSRGLKTIQNLENTLYTE